MNCLVSFCCVKEGRSGYAAVMVWRNVQVERPSCSTSGGQSEGIEREAVDAAEGVVVATVLGCLSFEPGAERAMAIHEETEVQERHLEVGVSTTYEEFIYMAVLTASRPVLTPHPSATASSHPPAQHAVAARQARPKAVRAIQ